MEETPQKKHAQPFVETRHSKQCSVCKHPQKQEIEDLYRAGRSANSLEIAFDDLAKNAVIRHMRFYGIERDLEAVLFGIVESGADSLRDKAATAAHMNEAVKSLAKLRGEWIDRTEMVPPGWEGKSEAEMAFFAETGRFPRPGELETIQ